MLVYDSKRRPIETGRQVGRGGESAIYHVAGHPDYLVKLYTTPHIAIYEQKLTWMLDHPPDDPTDQPGHDSFAWPIVMLYDGQGTFVGYMMPHVQNAVTALKVFNPRLRARTLPGFDRRYLHRTARNLAAAVEALHARDYVIGDLHESNTMVTSSALVTLIDTDSFQVDVGETFYPCIVGKPEYTPPELQGKSFQQVKRAPEHDYFSLGVLVFQLLMEGNHPFRGRWLGSGDPPPTEQKIRRGLFPYDQNSSGLVAPPPTGLAIETLHPEVVDLVQRCFVDGHQQPDSRPAPGEWKQILATAEGNLVACYQGHYYSNYLDVCPKCRTQAAPRRRPRPIPPRFAPSRVEGPVLRPTVRPASSAPLPARPSSASASRWSRAANLWVALVVVGAVVLAFMMCLMAATSSPKPVATRVPPTSTPTPLPQVVPRPAELAPIQRVTDARGVLMVFVPAGPFEMGSERGESDEGPVHTVTLDAFYIDQYEVTNAWFVDFLNEQSDDSEIATALLGIESEYFHLYRRDGVWQIDEGYADHPVVSVSWFDAQAYCEWRGARLPTEAEWEKAARGTDGRAYPWGEGIDCTMANYASCVGNTAAVGSYLNGVSPYGCLDMAGNVWELVGDWYQEDYYGVSASSNPLGPGNGTRKVARGGSWSNPSDNARATNRTRINPTDRDSDVTGFRCAVSDPAFAVIPTPSSAPPPAASAFASPSGPVVLIPAGPFEMGDEYHSSGQPVHTVILDAYYIDQYEVTNVQYAACVQTGACQPPGDCRHWGGLTYYDVDKAYHPVACVNWSDAQAYCEWQGGRLPTEAEWEKAARGTDGRTYPWGEDLPDCVKAQYGDCGEGTIPVGSKPAGASPYGVHDMAGNVREWVADWYDENYYARSPVNSPQGPSSGSSKVRRGGDWTTDATYLRTGVRLEGDPGMRSNRMGFRCVTPVPK